MDVFTPFVNNTGGTKPHSQTGLPRMQPTSRCAALRPAQVCSRPAGSPSHLIDDSRRNRYFTSMKVYTLGEEVLREKAVPVAEITDEIRTLISDMFVQMKLSDGIGLAAPQIGKSLRLFVVQADDDVERAFINPQIIETSTELCSYEEGCLSVPKYYEEVVRPERITVQALNERGRRFTLEADGLLARVIQHEYDHLDGILFIDRIAPDKKDKIVHKFREKAEKEQKKAEKTATKDS